MPRNLDAGYHRILSWSPVLIKIHLFRQTTTKEQHDTCRDRGHGVSPPAPPKGGTPGAYIRSHLAVGLGFTAATGVITHRRFSLGTTSLKLRKLTGFTMHAWAPSFWL